MKPISAQKTPFYEGPKIFANTYAIIFYIFLLSLAYLFRDNPRFISPEFHYLLVLLVLVNFVAWAALKITRFGNFVATLVILASCGIIAKILSYSGMESSNLWVLYILPIYTSCVLLNGRSVVLITCGAIAINSLYYLYLAPDLGSMAYFQIAIMSAILAFVAMTTWRVAVQEKSNKRLLEQSTAELERTENHLFMFRRLLGQMDDAILVINPGTGHMVDINGTWSRGLGYSREDLKRISLADFPGFLPRGVSWSEFVGQIRAKKSLRFECEPQRRNQTSYPAEVHIQWASQEGKDHLVAVLRDITERKIAEEKLVQAQNQVARSEKLAAIGRLASGVGHELRNPLGTIKNAVYYMKELVEEHHLQEKDASIAEVLKHAEKEIQQAANITSDLLDYSKAATIHPQWIDVNALLVEAKKDFEIPKNVRVVERYDPGLPKIHADPQKLHQVVINLASNGIQAMPSGGDLEISTRVEPSGADSKAHLILSVADHGVGISEEERRRLFEPWFTTKARGTGLGLAISLGIVRAHSGEIVVESSPSQGSTFIVKLPLSDNGKERSPETRS